MKIVVDFRQDRVTKRILSSYKHFHRNAKTPIYVLVGPYIAFGHDGTTPRKTIFCFSKCSERIVFSKASHQNMIFLLYYLESQYFFSLKCMILSFRWKMKDDLSQKRHRNIIFSVYSVKMVFLFPTNMILPLCQAKMIFS